MVVLFGSAWRGEKDVMDESETVVYHEKHGSGDGGERVPGSVLDVDIATHNLLIIKCLMMSVSTSEAPPL